MGETRHPRRRLLARGEHALQLGVALRERLVGRVQLDAGLHQHGTAGRVQR